MTELRCEALTSLVLYLEKERYIDDALRLLREDPECEVRLVVASALCSFARVKNIRREEIVRALANAALHDSDAETAAEAYLGIDLLVLRPTERRRFTEIPREQFDLASLRRLAGEQSP